MPAYETLHARHYDLIYAEKPYEAEARFVAARLVRAGVSPPARLLDVACGTGRHAIELSRLGYRVTGLDFNPALLERARANADSAGQQIELVAGDMRTWTATDDARFDAATCLFDSLGYAGGDEAVQSALRAIGSSLTCGGVIVLEVLNLAAMNGHADPIRVRSWSREDGAELLRIAETEVDAASGGFTVDYRLLELSPNGHYAQEHDTHSNRAFAPSQVGDLLKQAGFELLALEPAYEDGDEVDDNTWHLLVSARAK